MLVSIRIGHRLVQAQSSLVPYQLLCTGPGRTFSTLLIGKELEVIRLPLLSKIYRYHVLFFKRIASVIAVMVYTSCRQEMADP